MKKTLNTAEIENQLAGSVFFGKHRKASLSANQQVSKEDKRQARQAANQQTSQPVNHKTTKPVNSQTSEPLKKFASYLAENTFYELKALALQMRKKDYEVLQEAVADYIKKKKVG